MHLDIISAPKVGTGTILSSPRNHQKLLDVEGLAQGKDGFLITVTDIRDGDIGRGMIQDTTGLVKYTVAYTAIVFRPSGMRFSTQSSRA